MHLARGHGTTHAKGTHKAGESALAGSQAPGGAFLGLYEPTEATPCADAASGTARQEDGYEASIVTVIVSGSLRRWAAHFWM